MAAGVTTVLAQDRDRFARSPHITSAHREFEERLQAAFSERQRRLSRRRANG